MGSVGKFFGDLKLLIRAAITKPPSPDTIGSVALLVMQNAEKYPESIALISETETVTWRELDQRANRIANRLKTEGIGRGDCVALFMQNRIDFVTSLVGIGKLGAITGMINTNLIGRPLVHCINLIESKKCIVGSEMIASIEPALDDIHLEQGRDYLMVADTDNDEIPDWALPLSSTDTTIATTTPPEANDTRVSETVFYIFTSGTTGLPKAAIVSARRALVGAGLSANLLLLLKPSDRIYNCLPLYHGTGLVIGLLAGFLTGAGSVIRRRLSVSQFWDDIRENQCTSFIYIGEFIRYLMSTEPQENDQDNPIRSIVGNGLRPDIWSEFKNRFGIERIGEFYAASEGNGGFANVFNKDFTIGVSSAPVKLVSYDVAADEIIRNSNNTCVEAEPGTPGLLLIEVTEKSSFDGYTDPEATEKKLVRNVCKQGDVYFNSGDLMRTVDVGFAFGLTHYQFVDRIGDTFRWKSENVSTNEVGEIINQHEDIEFSNVYGVEIPGTDGRAGMAAVVFRGIRKPDLTSLSQHINQNLPAYARPIFIRVLPELPTTSTHKLQKNDLRDQAFHLNQVEDELLVWKPDAKAYCRLDADYYDQIMARQVRF